MAKLTAIFFVFLYLIATLRPIQPYVEYFINQDYIAEFLCINKDKPELQCNGKCHLAKQIEKQQEKEPFSSQRISLENYPIGFVTIYKFDEPTKYILKEQHNYFYNRLYQLDYSKDTSRPPELV